MIIETLFAQLLGGGVVNKVFDIDCNLLYNANNRN